MMPLMRLTFLRKMCPILSMSVREPEGHINHITPHFCFGIIDSRSACHCICIYINRINRITYGNPCIIRKNINDIARVALCTITRMYRIQFMSVKGRRHVRLRYAAFLKMPDLQVCIDIACVFHVVGHLGFQLFPSFFGINRFSCPLHNIRRSVIFGSMGNAWFWFWPQRRRIFHSSEYTAMAAFCTI